VSAWRRSAVVVALAAGTVIAACSNGDDGATGVGPRPDRISITEVRNPLFVGQSVQLEARALDAAGEELAVGDPVWSSGNIAVAEVTESGLLTGVSAGTATLTARINGRSGTVNVNVEALPPATVNVTMAGTTFSPADVTIRLNGTVNFVFPATAHDIVFATSPTGAPADIPSTTSRTVGRQFQQTGDFTYTSPLQPGKTGVIRVR
jgi:plastocyanin